ncbi:WD repeat-containing protein [Ascobolus immersus RN42]|uniref:DNA damage-binding protein CMR1 n=1 Tax=Ascobolus immersus RN42 TaxID=1160509 RepID=A0A3N4I1C4_ASCIM|nr:WD repeat-containing protein [Ascobolus immersus RN42]
MEELNEYERQRQENILKNQQLLRDLHLTASAIASPKPAARPKATPRPKKKVPKADPATVVPRRQSSRLAGLPADSEIAKRKADELQEQWREAENAKRARIEGDVDVKLEKPLISLGMSEKYNPTFTYEDVEATTDKELKGLREQMMGLKLWETFEPNQLKVVPERIYSMAFHPTVDKQLIFAGDKEGNLGILDTSQIKEEADDEDDDSKEESGPAPNMQSHKLHGRTISAVVFGPTSATTLYTSSYDGSVRSFDLEKGLSTEVYFKKANDAISCIQVPEENMLYFTTLDGGFGKQDLRTKTTQFMQLSEKKIGGFSTHPRASYLIATASLDRTVRIFDLRKINFSGLDGTPHEVAEHVNRLSVSSAEFNSLGQLATTSYDDTVKIYNLPDSAKWEKGHTIENWEQDVTIRHDNQTGRWVTILKAYWQQYPSDCQKLCIGNMKRSIDIYSGKGDHLAQLRSDLITAVPAVVRFHPTQNWVCGGNASGKLTLFM